MAYTKTTWVNGSAPDINAANLNKIEQGIYDNQLSADNLGDAINDATAKTAPADADYVPLMDSAASNILKKLSWAYIKSLLAGDSTALTNKPSVSSTVFLQGNNIVTDSNSRTFALSDNGKYLRFTGTSDYTWTIPLNSSVAFPVGTIIEVINASDKTLTIAKASGVTMNSADSNTKLSTKWKAASLKKVATDTWDVIGLEE